MVNNISVLVVDDEKNFRSLLEDALSPEGYLVDTAENGEVGLSKARAKHYDLAIVDVMMPKKNGLEFLSEALIHQPDLIVIMMSAVNDVERIIDATKKGAFHFLIKPIDLDVLYSLLNQIVEKIKLNEENIELKEKLSYYESFPSIIGNSPPLMKVIQQTMQIARTEAFCLILGESGTGKELICDLIHKKSPRAKGPLLKINCAAIPSSLLESELFGHEKGAFTGAYQTKKGLFELADGGTLFLDEIGDLEMALQSKLLRAIELGEFSRVGGQKVIKSYLRIVSATHRNLHNKIKNNTFREDLYYRLNVVSVRLPPLRDRTEDIPLLANHFIKELSIKNQKENKLLSQEAINYLMTYPFEGNIRELKNLMERAVVFSTEETIKLDDIFMDDIFQQEKHYLQVPITLSLADIEKLVINKVLDFNKGDKKKTADMLGVSVRKIFYKVKEEKEEDPKDH